MSESKARFQTAADVLAGWRDDVLTGKGPTLFPVGLGEWSRIEIGPGLVTLIGGPPGTGKTALVSQWIFDALRTTPTLRVAVCNIEMAASTLLDRQLARLSGIDLSTIRHRRLGAEHADRIDQALHTIESVADRLCFVRPPFDLANVAETADVFKADLIVLDYIQRIRPPGDHADRRGSVDEVMNYLRRFADAGVAVLAVSAVGRGKDKKGRSSYDSDALSMASYKESGELEYGADDAFLLSPDDRDAGIITLRHLKARNGEPGDIALWFDGATQTFTPASDGAVMAEQQTGRLTATLSQLWNRTPAEYGDGGDDE